MFRTELEFKDGEYKLPNYFFVSRLFNSWAQDYHFDALCSKIYNTIAEEAYTIKPDIKTVYDFGCGSGLSGRPFILKGASVFGCDISRKMLRYAKKGGYDKTELMDLSKKAPAGRFDLSLSVGVIGDYMPWTIVLPKMLFVSDTVAFTSIEKITDDKMIHCLEEICNVKVNKPVGGWSRRHFSPDNYFLVCATIKKDADSLAEWNYTTGRKKP